MPATRSQVQLGKVLGITQQAVSKLLKHPDWPAKIPKRARLTAAQVGKVKAWHDDLQEDRAKDDEPSGDLSRAYKLVSIRLKRAQADAAELKREIAEGEHVKRELLERALGGLATEFVRIFTEIEMSGPGRFAGMSGDDFGRYLDTCRRRIVQRGEIELRSLEDAAKAGKRGRGRKRAS